MTMNTAGIDVIRELGWKIPIFLVALILILFFILGFLTYLYQDEKKG